MWVAIGISSGHKEGLIAADIIVKIDPNTGKQTPSTNYRGKVGGAKVNVTTPGTMDQFDLISY